MLFVAFHLGLGDHMAFSPIVVKLAKTNKKIKIASLPYLLKNIKSFYINYTNVEFFEVTNNEQVFTICNSMPSFKLGMYEPASPLRVNENFIEWHYRRADIMPLQERWEHCPLLEASKYVKQLEVPKEDYIFVHDKDDCKIDTKYLPKDKFIIRNNESNLILSYAEIIKNAKEIHVVDSCFYHFSEAMPTTGKLIWHKYARNFYFSEYQLNNRFRKKWEVIY